jgi:HSP20 family molecular chaperone IbpA
MLSNTDDLVVLEFDLPEFKRDEISIKVEDDKINISARKKVENKLDEEDFRWFEKFSRTFDYSSSLPSVIGKDAEIEFRKGRLKISIPKK